MPPSFLTDGDLGERGSVFIAQPHVEAEIGIDLDTLARDPDGPLILDVGGVLCVERADLARFKKLLRLRARHKRLFGTELDAVPPFLMRDYRPADTRRDQLAADLEAAITAGDPRHNPAAAPAAPKPEPVTA